MSDNQSNEQKRFGLTKAELDNLKSGVQYIGSIVLVVMITFLIVATVSRFFGF